MHFLPAGPVRGGRRKACHLAKGGHRRPDRARKPLKTRQFRKKHKCDLGHLTEINLPQVWPATGSMRQMRLFGRARQAKSAVVAVPQIERNWTAHTLQPLQTRTVLTRLTGAVLFVAFE